MQPVAAASNDLEHVRLIWASRTLGLADSEQPPRHHGDLEKLRQRTKQLYKHHRREKRPADADKVVQAFGFFKKLFSQRQDIYNERKHSAARPAKAGVARVDEDQQARDPNSLTEAATVACRPTAARQLPVVGKKEVQQEMSEANCTAHQCNLPQQRQQPQRQQLQTSTRASARESPRHNSSGAAVVLVCACGETCQLQSLPELRGAAFLCPACRIRRMDPFNPLMEGRKGLLKLLRLIPPLVPKGAKGEARFQFRLKFTELDKWKRAGQQVEARMCCLDDCDVQQAWPQWLACKLNGRPAFEIEAAASAAAGAASSDDVKRRRRDTPQRLLGFVRPGTNTFEISLMDREIERFALAVVRTAPRSPAVLRKRVPQLGLDDCRQRVHQILFSSLVQSTSEDVVCPGSDRSRLTCPITLARMKTPARGRRCQHLQCFDVEAYLTVNSRMAFNQRWLCPVCNATTRPAELFIDAYLLRVLAKTADCDEEVAFNASGKWSVTAQAEPPAPSSDEEATHTNVSQEDWRLEFNEGCTNGEDGRSQLDTSSMYAPQEEAVVEAAPQATKPGPAAGSCTPAGQSVPVQQQQQQYQQQQSQQSQQQQSLLVQLPVAERSGGATSSQATGASAVENHRAGNGGFVWLGFSSPVGERERRKARHGNWSSHTSSSSCSSVKRNGSAKHDRNQRKRSRRRSSSTSSSRSFGKGVKRRHTGTHRHHGEEASGESLSSRCFHKKGKAIKGSLCSKSRSRSAGACSSSSSSKGGARSRSRSR